MTIFDEERDQARVEGSTPEPDPPEDLKASSSYFDPLVELLLPADPLPEAVRRGQVVWISYDGQLPLSPNLVAQ